MLAAKLLEAVFVRLGLVRILAYLCVGLSIAIMSYTRGYSLSSVTLALATIGIVLLLFRAGLESSLRYFLRSLRSAGLVAFGGVAGAMIAGLLFVPVTRLGFLQAVALGTIFSATSISVTVKTLDELGALNTKEAQVIIGAAVVDDVIGIALLSIVQGIMRGGLDFLHIVGIPVTAFVVWFGTAWVANRYADDLFKAVLRLKLEAGIEVISFALVLLLAFLAQEIGLSTILLAYAFGLGLSGFRYGARKIESYTKILVELFTPIFFAYVGSRVDIAQIIASGVGRFIWVAILTVILGFLSKIAGGYITARLIGFNTVQSLIIGIGMVPRAEVALVATAIALDLGLIDNTILASILIMVVTTLFVVPVALRLLYQKYEWIG